MSFQLRTELDGLDGNFWTHSATGEHADKHWSDFYEVADLSQNYGNGVVTNRRAFEEHLRTSDPAFEIVRELREDGSAGDIAGFAIADFEGSGMNLEVKVNDLVVAPEFRGRGVGGLLIGRMVTQRRMMMHPSNAVVTLYGNGLTFPDSTRLQLPGLHVKLYEAELDEVDEARAHMAKNGFSMLSFVDPSDETSHHELMQGNGSEAEKLGVMTQDDSQYRLKEYTIALGSQPAFTGRYEHAAFAAIAALNRPDQINS
jgi:GNAT superfamily N-acetyltransferase